MDNGIQAKHQNKGAHLIGLLQVAAGSSQSPVASTQLRDGNAEGARLLGLLQNASAKHSPNDRAQATEQNTHQTNSTVHVSGVSQPTDSTAALPQMSEGNRLMGLLQGAVKAAPTQAPTKHPEVVAAATEPSPQLVKTTTADVGSIDTIPAKSSPLTKSNVLPGVKKPNVAHLLQKPGVPRQAIPQDSNTALARDAMTATMPATLNGIVTVQKDRQDSPKPLTKMQLRKMLLHMIQNDPNFMGEIYSLYEKSFEAAQQNQ